MITTMIKPYAAKLNDDEYKKLRAYVIKVIKEEDTKRGLSK